MPENHNIIIASEFLRQYESKPTRKNYSSILKNYLTTFYPQLNQIKRGDEHTQLLDDISAQYLNQTRNYRNDLQDYRDTITHLAPKTRITKFTVIIRFFEDNEIKFPKRFTRNLIGKESEAISEEFIPKTTDIKRLAEHLPIQVKAITMVLSSSGMRPGEALKLRAQMCFHSLLNNFCIPSLNIPFPPREGCRMYWLFISSFLVIFLLFFQLLQAQLEKVSQLSLINEENNL